jgi:hypothetical protein
LDDFDCLGIGNFNSTLPNLAGQFSGTLILVASAACVWKDLDRAGMALNYDAHGHVMCVNDMIMHYPGPIVHAYSNNHAFLPKWIAARRDQFDTRWGKPKYVHSNRTGGKYTWPWPGHGTSTLNAVYTAIALGYTDIRLCGAPLDNSNHYFEPPWMGTNFEQQMVVENGRMKYWTQAKDKIFKGRVTSYSGRSRDLLGEPS